MALLTDVDKTRLTNDFAAMTRPVRLLFFTQDDAGEPCANTRHVLAELPALSDRITMEEIDRTQRPEIANRYGIDRAPGIALVGQDASGQERDSHIRFLGTPWGYEFLSLVKAILLVGGGASTLSDESRARLARIDKPISMHVFSTPTCPQCPRAVTLAHEIAFANANVTAYGVEATEFPDLARQYHVTGVPKTVINDQVEILGAVPEDHLVEQTLAGFEAGLHA